MSAIWAIIEFFNNLWSAYKEWRATKIAQDLADALAKKEARDKALEDSKKADTDADIFKDQSSVVDNKPS